MKNLGETIATIDLDDDMGIGELFVDVCDGGYVVMCLMPDGSTEETSCGIQKSMDDAIEAIYLSWGPYGAPWNLTYV